MKKKSLRGSLEPKQNIKGEVFQKREVYLNATLVLAATGNDAALVYGFDHGIGEFTKPGFGGGITLNAHNLFGSSTDILSELGGEDLSYSLGYGIKGNYGISSNTIGNKTIHATRGAQS